MKRLFFIILLVINFNIISNPSHGSKLMQYVKDGNAQQARWILTVNKNLKSIDIDKALTKAIEGFAIAINDNNETAGKEKAKNYKKIIAMLQDYNSEKTHNLKDITEALEVMQ